jgi:hypothetical protein
MKNSTIIGISVLAVAGASFYFYSKGKKSTTSNSTVTTPTTPTDDTKLLQNLGVTITPTTPTPYVKPVEGVPLLTSENIQKALLALGIDQTRGISELASPNYIEAKRIAGNMKEISSMAGAINMGGGSGGTWTYPKSVLDTYSKLSEQKVSSPPPTFFKSDLLANMTKKVNALGYKVLPNFDIEKM